MAKTDYKTIDDYNKVFSGVALQRMQIIRKLVHEIVPEVDEVISYQIPLFKIGKKYHLVYYCAFEKHLSISSVWSKAFLKEFQKDLKNMKVSKSVIQLPYDKPLPVDLIKHILIFRKKEYDLTINKQV